MTTPSEAIKQDQQAQGENNALWFRCYEFVNNQYIGEWRDEDMVGNADHLLDFVKAEISSITRASHDELVEALQELVAEDDHLGWVKHPRFDRARAAIAKATGAQS